MSDKDCESHNSIPYVQEGRRKNVLGRDINKTQAKWTDENTTQTLTTKYSTYRQAVKTK